MALGTEEATFNTAVDVFMAAWETMIDDGLAANEDIKIVWQSSRYGDNASDGTQGSDATAVFDTADGAPKGRVFHWRNNPDTASDAPFEIGGRPLFFKVTNAAGDLT